MTTTISAGTCGAIIAAATISVLAQSPPPQSQSATPQTTTTSATERRITVTGCLQPASPGATDTASAAQPPATTGTTGTTVPSDTASDSAMGKFVLANATISPAANDTTTTASQGATAPPATTTSSSAEESAQTYRLLANPTALSPHVGKKLELTGTIVDAGSSTTTTSSASGPLLKVEAGKVLATPCQQ